MNYARPPKHHPLGTILPGWGKIVGYMYIGEPYYFTMNKGVVGLCPVVAAPEPKKKL